MRKLERDVEYTTKGGLKFVVLRFEGPYAYGSDGWWRNADGRNAGKFTGEQHNPEYRRHVLWEEPVVSRVEQLELFDFN